MNITPKEKANRLYKLYKSYLPSSLEPDLSKALGQKFALICVDEILKAREAGNTGVIFDEEYWKEVKVALYITSVADLSNKFRNMTKKEAKIEALRIATAMLIHSPDFDDDVRCKSIDDEIKIDNELKELSNALFKRAVKLGGNFNQYTGYVDDIGK